MIAAWSANSGLNAGLSFWLPLEDAGSGAVNTTPALASGSGTATFTRATAATTILSTGLVGNVSSGTPRSCYSGAGVYLGYLAEQASTNLCLQAENFGTTWVAVGTPTRSAGAKTCGTVSLDLIGDDTAAAAEGYSQPITFTGDAVKAVSVFVAQGTATSAVVQLNDATATADRLLVLIGWSGGVPVINAVTGTHLGTDALGNGVYRIRMATTSVTAANTNNLLIYPANDGTVTLTGTTYFGGVQAENLTFCTSYIPTTTGTVARNADVLTYASAGNVGLTAGGVYMEGTLVDLASGTAIPLSLGTAEQLVYKGNGGGNVGVQSSAGNAFGAVWTTNAAIRKAAGSWGGSVATPALDGSVGPSGSFAAFTGNTLTVGSRSDNTFYWNGCAKNVRIWSRTLSDAELVAFTS